MLFEPVTVTLYPQICRYLDLVISLKWFIFTFGLYVSPSHENRERTMRTVKSFKSKLSKDYYFPIWTPGGGGRIPGVHQLIRNTLEINTDIKILVTYFYHIQYCDIKLRKHKIERASVAKH